MIDIKKLFTAFEKAEEITSKLDAQLEAEPENEKIAEAWDKAYNKEFKSHEALVTGIVEITSGMIDRQTARAMIAKKRPELKNLISRLA